jgi:hypothetical protein
VRDAARSPDDSVDTIEVVGACGVHVPDCVRDRWRGGAAGFNSRRPGARPSKSAVIGCSLSPVLAEARNLRRVTPRFGVRPFRLSVVIHKNKLNGFLEYHFR